MSNSLLTDEKLAHNGWTEIRARDQVVRFRRSGAGRGILLLHSAVETRPLWPELLDTLTSGFRLIVPAARAPDTDIDVWLSALLEGLGTSRLTVVASDEFCVPAIEQALLDPDHVSSVILICPGRGSEGCVTGTLGTTNQLPSVPLLMLRRDQPAPEILAAVHRFLSGSSGQSAINLG